MILLFPQLLSEFQCQSPSETTGSEKFYKIVVDPRWRETKWNKVVPGRNAAV